MLQIFLLDFNGLAQMRYSCSVTSQGIFADGNAVPVKDCSRLLKMLRDVVGGRQPFTGSSGDMEC